MNDKTKLHEKTKLLLLLLGEAATSTARKYSDEEIGALAATMAKQFLGTADEKLDGAFRKWESSHTDDKPRALPTVNVLWKLMGPESDTGSMPARAFERPRVEYMTARRAVMGDLTKLGIGRSLESAGKDGKHEHVAPTWDPATMEQLTTGRENCGKCTAHEGRVQRVEETLRRLPDPKESAPVACKCGVTGWVDPKATGDALLSARREYREVYPCRDHLPEVWESWLDGGLVS